MELKSGLGAGACLGSSAHGVMQSPAQPPGPAFTILFTLLLTVMSSDKMLRHKTQAWQAWTCRMGFSKQIS